jgi:hypothetical protein
MPVFERKVETRPWCQCPHLENGIFWEDQIFLKLGAPKCYYDGPHRSLRMLLGAARAHRRLVGIRSKSAFDKCIAYYNRCLTSHVPSVSAALFKESGRFPRMNYTGHGVENDVAYCTAKPSHLGSTFRCERHSVFRYQLHCGPWTER